MSNREQWLRNAMADVMQIEPAQISVEQSFAEQGVDSLMGLRLTRALQDDLGVEIELEWLFDYPNIRELAGYLDSQFGERAEVSAATTA
jgi:acyl carrier protein